MTEDDLRAIEGRAVRVPEGSWHSKRHESFDSTNPKECRRTVIIGQAPDGEHHRVGVCIEVWLPPGGSMDNAIERQQAVGEFVANAREDIPALVAEVKRLRAMVDERNRSAAVASTQLQAAWRGERPSPPFLVPGRHTDASGQRRYTEGCLDGSCVECFEPPKGSSSHGG